MRAPTLAYSTPRDDLAPSPPPALLSGRALVGWWVLSAVVLLAFIGRPPVQRTQEARVLGTAREMLGENWRQWLIPKLNGDTRLSKPPLNYWMAAAAFKVGGVNDTAGRVPTALVGWLTVGVTFLAARRLFGGRAGFFAAAALCSSYLFFRHVRLAETDAPAALFVTCAVYAFLRAADVSPPEAATDNQGASPSPPHPFTPSPPRALWLHAAAAASAMAFLAKGGPGCFPLLFMLAFAAVNDRWDIPRRFLTTGALFTLLLVAAPWYVYAATTVGPRQFLAEMRRLSSGENHGSPFYLYFPQVLLATMPWTGLVVAGLAAAVGRFRADPRARTALAWAAATFLPLLFIGNKQLHYLLTLMPALMTLAGWAVAVACGDEADAGPHANGVRPTRVVLWVTMAATGVAVLALPVAARSETGAVRTFDIVLALVLLVVMAGVFAWRRSRGWAAGVTAYAAVVAAGLAALVGVWYPSVRPQNPRTVAREIRAQFPSQSFCFYGGNVSLPLCYNLRTIIPAAHTRAMLQDFASADPDLIVICVGKDGLDPPKLAEQRFGPIQFVYAGRVTGNNQSFELYRVAGRGRE